MEKTKNFLNNQNYIISNLKHKKLFLGFFIGLFSTIFLKKLQLLFYPICFFIIAILNIIILNYVFLEPIKLFVREDTFYYLVNLLTFIILPIIIIQCFYVLAGKVDFVFKLLFYPFLRLIYTLEYLFLGRKYITFQLKPTYKIITEAKEINIKCVKNDFYEIIKK